MVEGLNEIAANALGISMAVAAIGCSGYLLNKYGTGIRDKFVYPILHKGTKKGNGIDIDKALETYPTYSE